jgi:UDP-GlcNAc3NAcA epimerase
MVRIATIVGARPQIIKASALSRKIQHAWSDRISEILIHTGQHYDNNMSGNFFGELGLPKPKYELNVKGTTHSEQTGRMMERLERVLLAEKPDLVIVFGDTNTTIAGSLAASKLKIPIGHVEAGLRSFNKSMPEEINRVLTDHVSSLLFCPGEIARKNLIREGISDVDDRPHTPDNPGVFLTGDIMIDNLVLFSQGMEKSPSILETLNIKPDKFILSTIHRDFNTDQPERLSAIIKGLLKIAYSGQYPVVLPIHPRTRTRLFGDGPAFSLLEKDKSNLLKIISPLSYRDIIDLQKNSLLIVTDSGGLQKEAYYYKKPTIVLRPETEWKEIVSNGCSALADADDNLMVNAFHDFLSDPPSEFPAVYGQGDTADKICRIITGEST